MLKQIGGLGPLSSAQRFRGPGLLALLVLLPVSIYLLSDPGPRWGDSFATLYSVAMILGFAGLAAFALNLVLGGRFGAIDVLFGGLDRMYVIHHRNGQVAYLLLLGHAVLMFAARATQELGLAVDLVTGGAGWAVTAGVLALVAMTVAIILSIYVRLNHEVFVYVQRSFGVIFVFAAIHVFLVSAANTQPRLLIWLLGVYAIAGLACWVYRSLFDDVLVRRREYRVEEANHLDDVVTEIVMTPLDKPIRHRPGQFVYVTFESPELQALMSPFTIETEGRSALFTLRPGEISHQFHPFSVTSPAGSEHLSIVVKAVGDYTQAMRALVQGAKARVEGPYGGFTLDSSTSTSQIWIAGGIGVTPFLSMARSLGDERLEVDLYYATKTQRQAHFEREFETISDRVPGFRVFQVVEESDGFVTAEKIAQQSGGLSNKEVFICGPPSMIDSLKSQLFAMGVRRARIHYEVFGFVR